MQISYIGMQTQEVNIKPHLKIIMKSDSEVLDEVMVVAYGTAKKSAFTGSASVVKSDQIGKIQTTNVANALTGKVSGVQFANSSGQPGNSTPTIRIRGISSIMAGNAPLIILDGSPYDGDLNTINTQDIESMTVLKDAASNALYGARGANGVIVITTKKGKTNDAKITLDAKWGVNTRATQDYNLIDSPAQYYEMYYSGLKNYYMNAGGLSAAQAHMMANQKLTGDDEYGLGYNIYSIPNGQTLIGANGRLNPNATLGNLVSYNGQEYLLTPDNWLDEAYKSSLRQEYNVSINAGGEKGSFYSSFGYLKNEGISPNSDYERLTGRLKADYQVKPWLKVGANFSYAHYESNSLGEDGASASSGNVFAIATQIAPIYPLYIRNKQGEILYDVNGNKRYDYGDQDNAGLYRPIFGQSNALSDAILNTHYGEGNALNGVGFFEVRFLKDFKFTSTNSVYLNEVRATDVTNPFYGQYASSNGIVSKGHARSLAYNYQQLLNYTKSFEKHNIDAMVGHEYYRTHYATLTASKSNMFDPKNHELSGAVTDGSNDSYTTDYNTEGYFGRLQYDYDGKYFVSASYRRDASSRFHPDNRWGNFWALSGGWRVSGEEFMKEFDWVNDLKIRFGYGVTGNNDFDASYMANTLSRDQYWMLPSGSWAFVYGPSSNVNPYLGWEEKKEWNIGVDYSFFGNRMYGKFDYYRRKIDGMIYEVNVPQPPYPNGKQWQNIGEMESKGWEFEVGGDIIQNKDFTWTSSLNMSHNSGKILTMYGNNSRMDGNAMDEPGWPGDASRIEEGAEIGAFHMWKFAGFDDKGDFLLYNKDGEVIPASQKSVDDKQYIGNYLPKVMMGWNNTFTYKNFDLGINMRSWIGFDVLNTYPMYLGIQGQSGAGQWNLWKPALDDPKYKDIRGVKQLCDYFLEDGSFLKIDAITLGYTLALSKYTKWAERLRVYGTVGNVATITGYSGHNPEVNITGWEGGVDKVWNCDPIVRTYTLGIQVTF